MATSKTPNLGIPAELNSPLKLLDYVIDSGHEWLVDNDMTLDEFYKLYPYHNPDINSDYWNQQHNRWKEIWKQDTI